MAELAAMVLAVPGTSGRLGSAGPWGMSTKTCFGINPDAWAMAAWARLWGKPGNKGRRKGIWGPPTVPKLSTEPSHLTVENVASLDTVRVDEATGNGGNEQFPLVLIIRILPVHETAQKSSNVHGCALNDTSDRKELGPAMIRNPFG